MKRRASEALGPVETDQLIDYLFWRMQADDRRLLMGRLPFIYAKLFGAEETMRTAILSEVAKVLADLSNQEMP